MAPQWQLPSNEFVSLLIGPGRHSMTLARRPASFDRSLIVLQARDYLRIVPVFLPQGRQLFVGPRAVLLHLREYEFATLLDDRVVPRIPGFASEMVTGFPLVDKRLHIFGQLAAGVRDCGYRHAC